MDTALITRRLISWRTRFFAASGRAPRAANRRPAADPAISAKSNSRPATRHPDHARYRRYHPQTPPPGPRRRCCAQLQRKFRIEGRDIFRRLHQRPVMLGQPLQRLPAQVQPVERRIAVLQQRHHPQALRVMVEPAKRQPAPRSARSPRHGRTAGGPDHAPAPAPRSGPHPAPAAGRCCAQSAPPPGYGSAACDKNPLPRHENLGFILQFAKRRGNAPPGRGRADTGVRSSASAPAYCRPRALRAMHRIRGFAHVSL
jgi:hypothetical protein